MIRPNLNKPIPITPTLKELFPTFDVWKQVISRNLTDLTKIVEVDYRNIIDMYGNIHVFTNDYTTCYASISILFSRLYENYLTAKEWNDNSLTDMRTLTTNIRNGLYELAATSANSLKDKKLADYAPAELEKYLANFSDGYSSVISSYVEQVDKLDKHFKEIFKDNPYIRMLATFINEIKLSPQPKVVDENPQTYAFYDLSNVNKNVLISTDFNNSIRLGADGKLYTNVSDVFLDGVKVSEVLWGDKANESDFKALTGEVASNKTNIGANQALIATNSKEISDLKPKIKDWVKVADQSNFVYDKTSFVHTSSITFTNDLYMVEILDNPTAYSSTAILRFNDFTSHQSMLTNVKSSSIIGLYVVKFVTGNFMTIAYTEVTGGTLDANITFNIYKWS